VANALALNWGVTPLVASFNHADPERTIDPALQTLMIAPVIIHRLVFIGRPSVP